MTLEKYLKLSELRKQEKISDDQLLNAYNHLSDDDAYSLKRSSIENYFKEENKISGYDEKIYSPSEKYYVKQSSYTTGKGTWAYVRACVYDVKTDTLIADIKKNYSRNFYCWIENHKNGHDYLITGEDYQGQTVIELDTGRIKNYMSPGWRMGGGWCFSSADPSEDRAAIIAVGCYWGGSYEYKLFKFSNPIDEDFSEIKLDIPYELYESENCDLKIESDMVTWTLFERTFKQTGETTREIEIYQSKLYKDWQNALKNSKDQALIDDLKGKYNYSFEYYLDYSESPNLWNSDVAKSITFQIKNGIATKIKEVTSANQLAIEKKEIEMMELNKKRHLLSIDNSISLTSLIQSYKLDKDKIPTYGSGYYTGSIEDGGFYIAVSKCGKARTKFTSSLKIPYNPNEDICIETWEYGIGSKTYEIKYKNNDIGVIEAFKTAKKLSDDYETNIKEDYEGLV